MLIRYLSTKSILSPERTQQFGRSVLQYAAYRSLLKHPGLSSKETATVARVLLSESFGEFMGRKLSDSLPSCVAEKAMNEGVDSVSEWLNEKWAPIIDAMTGQAARVKTQESQPQIHTPHQHALEQPESVQNLFKAIEQPEPVQDLFKDFSDDALIQESDIAKRTLNDGTKEFDLLDADTWYERK